MKKNKMIVAFIMLTVVGIQAAGRMVLDPKAFKRLWHQRALPDMHLQIRKNALNNKNNVGLQESPLDYVNRMSESSGNKSLSNPFPSSNNSDSRTLKQKLTDLASNPNTTPAERNIAIRKLRGMEGMPLDAYTETMGLTAGVGAGLGLTGLGMAGVAGGVALSENGIAMHKQYQADQITEKINQDLQSITQQTAENNAEIAELQNRLATESSILSTEEQAKLQKEIDRLEALNMLIIAYADQITGGHGEEDVKEAIKTFEQEKIVQPVSKLQRAKNVLHDYAGVYVNRLGRGVGSYFNRYIGAPISSVWSGFRTLNLKDRVNFLVEGMKSMTSSAAQLPKGAINKLNQAYRALIKKAGRENKVGVSAALAEQPASVDAGLLK